MKRNVAETAITQIKGTQMRNLGIASKQIGFVSIVAIVIASPVSAAGILCPQAAKTLGIATRAAVQCNAQWIHRPSLSNTIKTALRVCGADMGGDALAYVAAGKQAFDSMAAQYGIVAECHRINNTLSAVDSELSKKRSSGHICMSNGRKIIGPSCDNNE